MMADRSVGPGKEQDSPIPESAPESRRAPGSPLAGAVHDVNQMLAVVAGRAGLLRRRGPGPDWDANLRAMELAAQDAASILARLVAGEPDCDGGEGPAAVLREAVDDAGLLIIPPTGEPWDNAGTGDWRLENGLPADLAAALPAQVVREVLNNLLLNSLEASPGGVTVTCTGAIRNGRAFLLVRDNGPGLPAAVRSEVFRPGFSTSMEPGRGVGLAACRALLQRWHGDLRVAGQDGPGAAFELELPLAGQPDATVDSAPAADAHGARATRRVLIVDDESAVRDMLSEVMAELGCRVTTARNSAEALAEFVPGAYDLVVLDQSLPGMQGDELAARLRENDPAVAIVLATGWGREQALSGVNPKHVDLTATKPLALSKIMELLADGSALTGGRRFALDPSSGGGLPSEGNSEC